MYSLGSYSSASTARTERDAQPHREPGEGFYYAPTAPAFGPPSSASPHYGFRRNGSSQAASEQMRNGRRQTSSGEARRQAREGTTDGLARAENDTALVASGTGPASADRAQGRALAYNSNKDVQRGSSAPPSPARPSAWTSAAAPVPPGDYGVATRGDVRGPGGPSASPSHDTGAARSGLIISREQSERYNAFVNGSPFTHRQAQAKILELIQFWLSSPETGALIDSAVRTVMLESEGSKAAMGQVVEAWGGTSPVSNTGRSHGEKSDSHRELKRSQQKPRLSLEPEVIELEDGSPQSQKSTRKSEKSRRRSDSSASAASSGSGRHTTDTPSVSHRPESEADVVANTKLPSPAVAAPPPLLQETNATTPPHPPSEQATSSDTATSAPPSSTSFRRRYDQGENAETDRRTRPEEVTKENPAEKRPKEQKRPEHAATDVGHSPSAGQPDGKDGVRRVASTPQPTGRPQPPDAPMPTPKATPTPAASFDEIPRFYFPQGHSVLHQEIINGPISKKIENPHLKMVDGVTLMTAAIRDDERDHNSASLPTSPLDDAHNPAGSKSCPLSTLRCVEDCHVGQYIQREFSRLPAAPKFDVKSRVRSGGRFRGSNGTPLAKQEAAYRQNLVMCTQRICVQCFGLPRYFSFIVVRLIQREILESLSHNSSFRASKSPPNPAHLSVDGGTTKAEAAVTSLITAQHLKDFYATHLRGKDSKRRVFDVLALSTSLSRAGDGIPRNATAADANKEHNYLVAADFIAYLEGLLLHHPGLSFLRETPDFQSKYVETVVYRIFYEVDRFDRGRISFAEFCNSRLMDAFRQVDATDDINTVLLFFSYEHFYVLYCRFWELNEMRNMQLSREDLARYAPEDTMNPVIVNRVFAGIGRPVRCPVKDRIGYEDFVWFCLSEEDKSTPTAIRYWFRILDTDGDGVLSLYELQNFYDATRNKIAEYVVDNVISFNDVVCQVFDMLRVPRYRPLTLVDFQKEPEAAHVALSMLTNVIKFLQFEQRDPFVAHQDRLLGGLEQSRWDRFARIEYDRMAQEADE